jgi:DNA-directed RNA polymerase subunit M/transcription elongation factor TFIIS
VGLKSKCASLRLSASDIIFCPECGTLAFPGPDGNIKCPNGRCNYIGPTKGKVKLHSGEEIDTTDTVSSSKVTDLKHLTEVIDDADQFRGVLTHEMYVCPKCEATDVFAELKQTRASDEPETRILTCKDCSHGWREY